MKKSIKLLSIICLSLAITFLPLNNVSDSVIAKTSAIKISKVKITVKKGRTKQLTIKGTRKKVIWKSSNTKIVSVSSNGIITGKTKGTARVTAKVGKKRFQCKVTVINKNDYSPVLTAGKIKKGLKVPSKAKVTIRYGKKYYKRSFGATLVPVHVYENNKLVAGAHFFKKDGSLGCNIANYGTFWD